MTTYATKAKEIERKWYLVDAQDKVLGKLGSKIARYLMGKTKKNWVPYLDMGDYVVVVNAEKIAVTGKKEKGKKYYWHSGYPGGLKEARLKDLREKKGEEILKKAVWGMMPKTRLGRKMFKKLYVFKGEEHKFKNKKLEELKL